MVKGIVSGSDTFYFAVFARVASLTDTFKSCLVFSGCTSTSVLAHIITWSPEKIRITYTFHVPCVCLVIANLRYDDEMRRRRNETKTTTTTTGSSICTDAGATQASVCDFVVHRSSRTKFARESGSGKNVSKTCSLEALFRGLQLIFRSCVPGRVL